MESIKVLFVSQEITPYLPETEMSVIARNLPQGIQERGKEIRTFMPKFGCINERRNQLHEVIRLSGMNLIIDDADHPLIIKVASIQSARMQVYFIDNEDYFQRKYTLADENKKFFKDNDERAIFFARGVIETVRKLRWDPDVIHCHGWFTGLLPLYIKKSFSDDPIFMKTKVVHSVYDNEFPDTLDKNFKNKLLFSGITEKDVDIVSQPTYANVSKLAIDMSDGVIYGSPNINEEVKEYVEKTKKPLVTFKGEDEYIDAYNTFYEKLVNEDY
ncbi:MAG: glycogen synthase [Bacteroidetes bacterium]|jgi:starch synthase|nr:glycogen synthase [Bacteroidota bacterium]